jgi:hypothetical protein
MFLNLESKSQTTSHNINSANSDTIGLCKAVVDLYESLQHAGNAEGPIGETVDTWEKYCDENKLTFSHEVLKNHRLYQPNASISSTPARGRMNTIHKELANLQTSLPDGIFLKVDEVSYIV